MNTVKLFSNIFVATRVYIPVVLDIHCKRSFLASHAVLEIKDYFDNTC